MIFQEPLKVLDIETKVALEDKSASGRVQPWREKKLKNELLSAVYDSINSSKAERLCSCSTFLCYSVDENRAKHLERANFCRVRLCPICSWRRARKIYAQVSRVLSVLQEEDKTAYLLLTLTVRNCQPSELGQTLDNLMRAWDVFLKTKEVKRVVKGWYRGLEITHDVDELITPKRYKKAKKYYDDRGLKVGDANPNYNLYHPHFHVLVAVNKSYFTNREYLSQKVWQALWARSAKLDYLPQVDVRRVSGFTAKDVAEVAKYSVKDSDYIIPDDWDLTVDTVQLLDRVLDRRRFMAFGGVMKQIHKALHLDDADSGDLIHVEDDSAVVKPDLEELCFFWYSGYSQYYSG